MGKTGVKNGDFRLTIGETMKKLRLDRGLSVWEVEELTGIAHNSIYGYESDRHAPGVIAAMDLADLYGVTLDELVGRAPPESKMNELKRLCKSRVETGSIPWIPGCRESMNAKVELSRLDNLIVRKVLEIYG